MGSQLGYISVLLSNSAPHFVLNNLVDPEIWGIL